MDVLTTVHEKFSITAWERYKQRRYGLRSCKVVLDPFFISDIKELYEFYSKKTACDENVPCVCSLEKLEETIKTM